MWESRTPPGRPLGVERSGWQAGEEEVEAETGWVGMAKFGSSIRGRVSNPNAQLGLASNKE